MSAATVVTGSSARPVRRIGRVLLGIALAGALVLVIVVVLAVTRTPERPTDYLAPTSGGPSGTRALVNVLADEGVDVRLAETLAEVRAVDSEPTATTLVLFDAFLVLGTAQHEELLRLADHVVVLEPYDPELADLAPGVELVGYGPSGPVPTDCGLPAAQRAERVDARGYLYDVSAAEAPVIGCFADGDDRYTVVDTETAGTRVTLVGIGPAFTNGEILAAGNAAFALNLLGERETLIWYSPGPGELQDGDIPSPVSLTPDWLTPLLVLLAVAGLAAAIWRGRRLGALVAEKLPVVVRANETIEGRARLYERAGARAHALDALRIGATARLARLAGLPRRATVPEIVDAVAALAGRDRAAVAELLVGRAPATDAELVRLSDDLLRLEADVARVVRGR